VEREDRAVIAQEQPHGTGEAEPIGEGLRARIVASVGELERRPQLRRGGVEVAREVRSERQESSHQETVRRRVADGKPLGALRDRHDRLPVARERGAPAREAEQVQRALGVCGCHLASRRGQDPAGVGRHAAGQLDETGEPIEVGAQHRVVRQRTRPLQQRPRARHPSRQPRVLGRAGQ